MSKVSAKRARHLFAHECRNSIFRVEWTDGDRVLVYPLKDRSGHVWIRWAHDMDLDNIDAAIKDGGTEPGLVTDAIRKAVEVILDAH